MMKRGFLVLFFMLYCMSSAFAQNVKVKALSDFTTQNPPETWSVQIVDGFEAKDGTAFYSGSIITGRIENIKTPKRLKRNAQFTFIPVKYYDAVSRRTDDVKMNIEGKYSVMSDISAGEVIKTGAVTAGSKLISGFISPGVALVEGLIKNEEGNRAKSAVKSIYESTPVSYIEKGKELIIKENQIFIMSFKLTDEIKTANEDFQRINTYSINNSENEGVFENSTYEEIL